jgi:hypothetical protein
MSEVGEEEDLLVTRPRSPVWTVSVVQYPRPERYVAETVCYGVAQ